MDHLSLVDSLVADRVVIFGSLPPHGRDVDLLVRAPEEEALAGSLADHGFLSRDHNWVRFGSGPPEILDLAPAASWALAPSELEALFAEGRPLEGYTHLVRPAPHHAVLILARKVAQAGGRLAPKRRARLEAALDEAPDAWERAAESARAWDAQSALSILQSAYRDATPEGPVTRARGLVSDRRGRRGFVVALSGLDGAGKSTQAARIRDSLERLGHTAVVEWPAIHGQSGLLRLISRVGRRLTGSPPSQAGSGSAPEVTRAGGASIHERNVVLTRGWASLVAIRGAVYVARRTWPHVALGRIVVCDRYVLDSWVHLQHQFGPGDYPVLRQLLKLTAPRPRKAYLLEVDPVLAASREPDRTAEENIERSALYREMAPGLGVARIDGQLPREEICSRIVREVWEAESG